MLKVICSTLSDAKPSCLVGSLCLYTLTILYFENIILIQSLSADSSVFYLTIDEVIEGRFSSLLDNYLEEVVEGDWLNETYFKMLK